MPGSELVTCRCHGEPMHKWGNRNGGRYVCAVWNRERSRRVYGELNGFEYNRKKLRDRRNQGLVRMRIRNRRREADRGSLSREGRD
jgi:hypothetical protein